jgi:hypothetical protein
MSDVESNGDSTKAGVAQEILTDLRRLGVAWIKYGVSVGEAALQTSARSLDDVAKALRTAADKLHQRVAE